MRYRAILPALVLTFGLASGTSGCAGCASALLEGPLVADGGGLGVQTAPGRIEHVRWEFGYGVRRDASGLVLTDLLGTVKAREGDWVRVGGGEVADGTWGACGLFELPVDPRMGG
jgi:hypothetical protein